MPEGLLATGLPIVAAVGLWVIWAWSRMVSFVFSTIAVVVGAVYLVRRLTLSNATVSVWNDLGRYGGRWFVVGSIVFSTVVIVVLVRSILRRTVGQVARVAVVGASVALLLQAYAAFVTFGTG